MEMKEYTAPKMTVVELDVQINLLQGSDGPDLGEEYEGELGFNFDVENKKNA